MTAAAADFEVKGWCPGALRPMESGDGLIVRIRPLSGSIGIAQMRGIADAAARDGNGHIDLTRRANLQIRGVSDATLAALLDALRDLGLLDARPEAEAVRNILISPLAGLDPSEAMDMRPLATALVEMLAAELETWALPAKFAFVLDGGGRLPLSGERADLRLLAIREDGETLIAIGIGGHGGETEWLGSVEPGFPVTDAVSAILQHRMKMVTPERIKSDMSCLLRPVAAFGEGPAAARAPLGPLDMGDSPAVLGLGVPFGSMEAAQLRALADAVAAEDGADIRLSPWRAFYIPLRDGFASERLMASARKLGFVTDAGDPLMRVQACPGRPACRAAHGETRSDARRIGTWMGAAGFSGTVHVSGCAKGCASSRPADLTLVGVSGGYRLLRNAAARDEGGAFIDAAAIGEDMLHG
jgi:precorrin-3B synthase